MRAIKYRAKTPKGEWEYGYYLEFELCDGEGRCSYIKKDGRQPIKVIKDTVGQFTGLTDKNGKEIYEGDILGFTTKKGMGYQKDGIKVALPVVFGRYNPDDCTLSEYVGFWVEYSSEHRGSISYEIGSHGAKVIGNIYDNPELINE